MMTQHTIHYLRPLYAVLKLCSEANIGYCRRTRSGSRIIYITDLNFIGGSVILTLLFGGLRGPSVEVGATDAPATSTCGPWERTLHTNVRLSPRLSVTASSQSRAPQVWPWRARPAAHPSPRADRRGQPPSSALRLPPVGVYVMVGVYLMCCRNRESLVCYVRPSLILV